MVFLIPADSALKLQHILYSTQRKHSESNLGELRRENSAHQPHLSDCCLVLEEEEGEDEERSLCVCLLQVLLQEETWTLIFGTTFEF